MSEKVLLRVTNLKKYFPVEKGGLSKTKAILKAVDDVSFTIYKGEAVGVVGESGCGKSTVGKSILRAFDVTGGKIEYAFGDDEAMDVSELSAKELRAKGFRKNSQMIFQDPNSSLNPRMTILDIISEPLITNGHYTKEEVHKRVGDMLERVGLDKKYLKRYPHAFSGGQRQRISIARALITNPEFIVADEPTSALDVSTQAQILNLMIELKRDYGLTYLFISHNMGVIRKISDRVVVMYLGRVVEFAPNAEIFSRPRHPYTEVLLKSIPIANPKIPSGLEVAPGEIGNPIDPPSGCHFHPRCKFCKDICKQQVPQLREVSQGHFVACHNAEAFQLQGVPERKE